MPENVDMPEPVNPNAEKEARQLVKRTFKGPIIRFLASWTAKRILKERLTAVLKNADRTESDMRREPNAIERRFAQRFIEIYVNACRRAQTRLIITDKLRVRLEQIIAIALARSSNRTSQNLIKAIRNAVRDADLNADPN